MRSDNVFIGRSDGERIAIVDRTSYRAVGERLAIPDQNRGTEGHFVSWCLRRSQIDESRQLSNA